MYVVFLSHRGPIISHISVLCVSSSPEVFSGCHETGHLAVDTINTLDTLLNGAALSSKFPPLSENLMALRLDFVWKIFPSPLHRNQFTG